MKLCDAIIRVTDCETTGFDPKEHRVVEIAVVDMNLTEGVIDGATSLVNPKMEIPIEVMAIHHITNEMVQGAPLFDTIWPSLRDGGEHGDNLACYAAHNAAFDFAFLDTAGGLEMCTLRIARHFWPGIDQHKNQYLRYYLGVKVPESMPIHRALGDATVTALNLQVMLKVAIEEKGIETVDQLITFTNRPVLLTTCRFGNKHRDIPWAKVPKSYLSWMKREVTDMDIDLAHTVEHYLSC